MGSDVSLSRVHLRTSAGRSGIPGFRTGLETPRRDTELIKQRLREGEQIAEEMEPGASCARRRVSPAHPQKARMNGTTGYVVIICVEPCYAPFHARRADI